MLVIPPFPYHPNPGAFDAESELQDAWKACPELFFISEMKPLRGSDSDIIKLDLMFYSTFEPILQPLTPNHPLQQAGMEMVYEPMPEPCLYVDHIESVVSRLALMPCFIKGNKTPTIPQSFQRLKAWSFPFG